MGREAWSRRWLAASGGVLINGLLLVALAMLEEPPPVVEDAPALVVEIERPPRSRSPDRPSRSRSGRPPANSSSRDASTPAAPAEGQGAPGPSVAEPAPDVEDRWRVDPKAVDRWKLTEGVPEWGWGRYYRACKGLSSEHMTPDEKERCYGGWGGGKDRRPSPAFIGPIDERRWAAPAPGQPPSRFDKDVRRQQRCRDYRRGRTPGFSERNLESTGSPPVSLREGGCE